MSDQNNEGKKHGPRRKRVYIAVISSAATVGVALTLIFASSVPWGAELLTQGRESSVDKEASSANSESDSTAISGEETDSENSGSRGNESTTEDQTPVLPSEETKQEECETPVAGSEYVVIVEIRHCEFAYFELDDYAEPKEITREEATRQRVEDNSDTVDWAPTPPSDNASSSSDSNNQDNATEPEPEESASTVDDYEDTYEASIMCPVERSENPEVYDACRESFVMPTSIEFTGIQSCTVIEEGNIEGMLGFKLQGGSIADATWFGVSEGSHRNASKYFNILGLSEDSGESWVSDYIITIYFLSMDPRYDGVIAEKTYRGRAVDDVSKCY